MKKILTLTLTMLTFQAMSQKVQKVVPDSNGNYHPITEIIDKECLVEGATATKILYIDCLDFYRVYETKDHRLFIIKRNKKNKLYREYLIVFSGCAR